MRHGARASVVIFLTIALSGCGIPYLRGYGENGLSRDEFEQYVERVFRLQNRLTNEVMLLSLGSEESSNYDTLLLAEHDMHELCRPLNEYAARSIDHQSVGLLLMRQVERSAVSCEQSAKHVELLLKQVP